LAQAQQVPLAVPEPGGAFTNASRRVVALHLGDAVHRDQAGNIDLLEHHPAVPQLGNHRLDVIDLPRHLGMGTRRHARRLKQREPPAAAPVAQPAGPLLHRFQAKLLGVKRPRPCQVLCRQAGGHVTVPEHAVNPLLAGPGATLRRGCKAVPHPVGGVRRAGERRRTLVERHPGDGWPAGRRLGSAQARVCEGAAGVAGPPLVSRFAGPARGAVRPAGGVRPGEPGWPGPAEGAQWAKLRTSVGGRLVTVESPFAACTADPGSPACTDRFQNLRNPFYIGDSAALTETLGWTDAWTSRASAHAVLAESSADVAAA